MESQNIEYKQSWKDEYLKWICGFANAQGGTLYIGIDDNENVVGVDNAKYLLDNLPNKCIQATGIVPDFENLTQKGKAYLTIHIKASDHLGSASWITECHGDAVQHLQYLPYGDPYINQRLSGYNERFTFTGKERDEETGYGYFGARYMDHELMTMWLSVDPMSDKYPSISPYAYCAWNPIKLVDPDGKEIVIKDGEQTYYYRNGHVYLSKKHGALPMDSKLGKEASKIKKNLDIMSKDKAGAKVINRLVGNKKQTYTIAADASSGDGSYNHISNKVSLVSGKANNLGSLSHELFHAYQDDKGRTPHTIYNELEAYVFSGVIYGASLGITSTTDLNYNEKGVGLAKDLKRGKPFNENTFQYLLDNFKSCSAANWKGTYTSYSTNPGNYKASESLLKDLFQ